MQALVLAGQQLVVDGLADQRVAEDVGAVVGDLQDVARDGGAQRGLEVELRQAADGRQQGVADPDAARGRDAQDALSLLGKAFDRAEDQVGEGVGHLARAVVALHQGLDEQRDALAALVDGLDAGVERRDAENACHLPCDLVARQARQIEPEHARHPAQLGQDGAERMLAVQVVRAVGQHHEHLRLAQVAAEEGDQVAAGPVGPVDVLHDQHHGPRLCQPFEQGEELLEEPGPAGVGVAVRARLAELGQQSGQVALGALGQQRADPGRADLSDELAERGGERSVGEAVAGELDAAAEQHVRAVGRRALGEALHQSGLADPCFAAQQDGGGRALTRLVEGLCQDGQLSFPPHEDGTDRSTYHVLKHGMPFREVTTGLGGLWGPAAREDAAGLLGGGHDFLNLLKSERWRRSDSPDFCASRTRRCMAAA
ncbi:hypothetical protein GCM10020219_071560 [Nonomuraea dietziae]